MKYYSGPKKSKGEDKSCSKLTRYVLLLLFRFLSSSCPSRLVYFSEWKISKPISQDSMAYKLRKLILRQCIPIAGHAKSDELVFLVLGGR
jgi:hypothetical protein